MTYYFEAKLNVFKRDIRNILKIIVFTMFSTIIISVLVKTGFFDNDLVKNNQFVSALIGAIVGGCISSYLVILYGDKEKTANYHRNRRDQVYKNELTEINNILYDLKKSHIQISNKNSEYGYYDNFTLKSWSIIKNSENNYLIGKALENWMENIEWECDEIRKNSDILYARINTTAQQISTKYDGKIEYSDQTIFDNALRTLRGESLTQVFTYNCIKIQKGNTENIIEQQVFISELIKLENTRELLLALISQEDKLKIKMQSLCSALDFLIKDCYKTYDKVDTSV